VLTFLAQNGVEIYLNEQGELRAKGNTEPYKELMRIWRTHLKELVSPKCKECGIAKEYYEGFYCPLGCKT